MKKAYRLAAILLSLAWMGCGNAAAAASYVVLSLVDHQLSVGTVDGRSNAPQWASYPRTDGAFDLVALQSTDAAIHKVEPDASVILLRTTDRESTRCRASGPRARGSTSRFWSRC